MMTQAMLIAVWGSASLTSAEPSTSATASATPSHVGVNHAQRVSAVTLERFLKVNPQWRHVDGALQRLFTFSGGFGGAVAFVQRCVKPADAMNHHPDLQISYNRVRVTLTTHDAGGLTAADLKLAEMIDTLAQAQ